MDLVVIGEIMENLILVNELKDKCMEKGNSYGQMADFTMANLLKIRNKDMEYINEVKTKGMKVYGKEISSTDLAR